MPLLELIGLWESLKSFERIFYYKPLVGLSSFDYSFILCFAPPAIVYLVFASRLVASVTF
jgi:hypothetical protein